MNNIGKSLLIATTFTPQLFQFTTAGTNVPIVIPDGATNVLIEIMSQGGGGNSLDGTSHVNFGGGGGAAYSASNYSCVGQAGNTLLWTIGTLAGQGGSGLNTPGSDGCAVQVQSGTMTITTMSCTGGKGAPITGAGATGTPTGGNLTNNPGQSGTVGQFPTGHGGASGGVTFGSQIFQGTGGPNDTVSNPQTPAGFAYGGGGGGHQAGGASSGGGQGASPIVSFYFT